jgi:hypothetical protein
MTSSPGPIATARRTNSKVTGAAERRERLLEGGDLVSEDERASLDDVGPSRGDVIGDRRMLNPKVYEGNGLDRLRHGPMSNDLWLELGASKE